jgi:hypothetical protein
MKPYGAKRHFGRCQTSRPKSGGKIHVSLHTKNHKFGRMWLLDMDNAFCMEA